MNDPKKHHTVPRFYLSGFCDREVHVREGHGRDGDWSRCRVWVHDVREGRVRVRGVKKLTTETHFYSLEASGGKLDVSPERQLSRLESAAAPITRKMYFGRKLSSEEAQILALFFASMKFRGGGYRDFAYDHVEKNRERIKAIAFPNADAVGRALRRDGHPEGHDPEAVRRIYREARHGPMKLDLTKNHLIGHMFDHSRRVARVLLGQDWTFLWAPRGHPFVTSDDPVFLLGEDLEAPGRFWGDVGFASPDATKVLPLTQRVCLAVGSRDTSGSGSGNASGSLSVAHGRASRAGVRFVNSRQARHYDRYLIAGKKEAVEALGIAEAGTAAGGGGGR